MFFIEFKFFPLPALSLSVSLSLPHARLVYAAPGSQGCALRGSERTRCAQAQRAVRHGLAIDRYQRGKFLFFLPSERSSYSSAG